MCDSKYCCINLLYRERYCIHASILFIICYKQFISSKEDIQIGTYIWVQNSLKYYDLLLYYINFIKILSIKNSKNLSFNFNIFVIYSRVQFHFLFPQEMLKMYEM